MFHCKSSPGKRFHCTRYGPCTGKERGLPTKFFSSNISLPHQVTFQQKKETANANPRVSRLVSSGEGHVTQEQRSGTISLAPRDYRRSLHKHITFQSKSDIAEPLPCSFPPRSINNLPSFLKSCTGAASLHSKQILGIHTVVCFPLSLSSVLGFSPTGLL